MLNAEKLVKTIVRVKNSIRKPIVAVMPGGSFSAKYRLMLEADNIPAYNSPKAAINALDALVAHSL